MPPRNRQGLAVRVLPSYRICPAYAFAYVLILSSLVLYLGGNKHHHL